MAQTECYISGRGSWVKLLKGQEDIKYKKWSLDLYLPDDQVEVFNSWKCEIELRDSSKKSFDPNIGYEHWIKLGRPTMKLIKDKIVNFDPPEVIDSDGNEWTGGPIGPGSELTCKVVVYDTMKGKGVRLEKVRVDVHKPLLEKEVDTSNVDSPF